MRITILSGLYPPYGKGGAEAVVAEAAAEFASAGHEVSVITAKPFAGIKSLVPEVAQEKGIKIYRFFPLNIFFYGNIGRHNFFTRALWHAIDLWNVHVFITISKLLKNIRPDLVLTHNIKGFGFILPSALLSVRRENDLHYRWIHTLHDVQLVAPSGVLKMGEENKLSNKIFSILTRALFCSPDIVVSPSKWLLDFYSERGFFPKSEKRVILNPVKKCSMLHATGFMKNSFLYLGQIEEHKGILFLMDAFKKSLNKNNCTLTIAGGGSLLEEVKKLAADTPEIKVLGPVPHEDVGGLLESHGAVIVPSLAYENSPSVISESHFYGVPVIASRIGGIPEMVEDSVNGWLFEPGNAESLISALERFISSPLPPFTPKSRSDYVSDLRSV